MRGSTTPTLPGGPSRPPWTPSGQPYRRWLPGWQRFRRCIATRGAFALLVDTIEQGALRSPLATLDQSAFVPLDPDRCSAPASTKGRCRLSLWKLIDPWAQGTYCAGDLSRGERARKAGVPTAYGAGMARKKRAPPISYRPPAQMRDEFTARVRNSGLSINGYITRAVFAGDAPRTRPQPRLDRAMAATLLAQAAGIADQLSKFPEGTTERDEALRACREELLLIRTFLMQLAGREP